MDGLKLMLTRDQILAAEDLPTTKVDVPEWGGVVNVRTMTGAQRDELEIAAQRDKQNIRARVAFLTMIDENGEPLFTRKDIDALGKKSATALDRVYEAAMSHNKVSDKDIAELEGNS